MRMSDALKTKMADKLEVCDEGILSAGSDKKESEVDSTSVSEKRYSMKEAKEIGRDMLESIQSTLLAKVGDRKIEDIQDPYVKAWKYMEKSEVLLILEILLTKLVYEQPEVPVQFMADEIQNMKGRNIKNYQTYMNENTEN